MKATLYSLTNVPLERQKIIGLVRGKLPPDEDTMYVHLNLTKDDAQLGFVRRSLKLVDGKKFTLVGTPEGDGLKDPSSTAIKYR